ncbi:MAG: alpha/beta fold hydrolase [Anaerolineae bacterium]|jgi:dipeptidyl aminopeptidase/acylaminoacyl peptidase|nr:alpha/beta fold hydrolase [Anaerolineae bacterium]
MLPELVYFHGGAGLFGSPDDLDPRHRARLEGAGFAVISADYPKAIDRSLHEVLAAVAETVRRVASGSPTGTVVVMGHSFGGYLALWLAATQPSVARAVALAGYADLLAAFYTEPSAHYLAAKDLAGFRAELVTVDSPPADKYDLYLYLRQTATWPDYVSKGDPASLAALSPLLLPPRSTPVLLVHGEADGDVPCAASVAYYQHVSAASPESRLVLHPTGDHGLMFAMDQAEVAALWDEVVAFCKGDL